MGVMAMAMATPGMCQAFQRVQAFHFPALELAAANSDTPTNPVTMGSREAAGGNRGWGPAPHTPHQAQTGQPCWG